MRSPCSPPRRAAATTRPSTDWDKRLGPQVAILRREILDRVEVRCRVPIERRFRPERVDVHEHRHVVDVAGIPGVESRAHVRGPRHVVRLEFLRDRHADGVDLARHQRRHFGRDRLGERRQPDPGREGRRLVLHVDDVGLPLAPGPRDHARLHDVQHVRVAVVVVADVLLIQLVQRRHLVGRPHVLAVPVDDDVLSVGIDRRPEQEHVVVENLPDLRIGVGLRQQVVRQLDRVLGAGDLAGVQPAADVHERLALARQQVGVGRAQSFGVGELLRDVPVVVELRQILRRRDDGERPGMAGGRDPHVHELDAVAGRGEPAE